jgi:hypothetical protein
LSATAIRIKTSTVLLEYFADLSAQGDRSRDNDSTLSSAFNMGHFENGNFSNDVLPAAIFTGAADLASTSSLTAEGLNVQFGDATINSTSSLTANAIKYRLRGTDRIENVRPLVPADSNLSTSVFPTNTNIVVFGTYASQIMDNNLYYLEYQDSTLVPDNTNEWIFESFVVLGAVSSGGSTNELITIAPSNMTSYNDVTIKLTAQTISSARRLRLQYYDSNDTFNIEDGTTTLSLSPTKHHITLAYKPGTGIKVWLDGSLEINESFTGDLRSISDPSTWLGYAGIETGTLNHTHFYDETRILQSSSAFSDAGITFANSSQTVPTSAYTNNTSTQLLLHYENNYRDDDAGTQLLAATTLSSATSLTSTLTGQVLASATLSAFNSTITAAVKTGNTVASLDTTASLSASGGKTVQGACQIDCATALGAGPSITALGSSTQTATSSLSSTGNFTASGNSTLNSISSLSVDSTGFVGVEAVFGAIASANATGTKIKPLASSIISSANITAIGDRTRSTESTVNTTATVAGDATRLKQLSATLSGIAATVTAAVKTGNTLASLDTTTSLSATANAEFIFEASVDSVASISAEPVKTVESNSTQNSTTTLLSTPVKTVGISVELELTSAASITATVVKQTDAISLQNSSATLSVVEEYIRPFGSDQVVETNLIAAPTKTVSPSGSLETSTSLVAEAGKLKITGANISSAFNASILARLILPNIAVYRVPTETRIHSIQNETTLHTITREDRTHKVLEGA